MSRTHLEVCAVRCDQCLFTPERIVDGARMAEVLRSCRAGDTHFSCHKGTLVGRDICCRGFWDTQPHSTFMQIAARLNQVRFVEIPEVHQEKRRPAKS